MHYSIIKIHKFCPQGAWKALAKVKFSNSHMSISVTEHTNQNIGDGLSFKYRTSLILVCECTQGLNLSWSIFILNRILCSQYQYKKSQKLSWKLSFMFYIVLSFTPSCLYIRYFMNVWHLFFAAKHSCIVCNRRVEHTHYLLIPWFPWRSAVDSAGLVFRWYFILNFFLCTITNVSIWVF